MLQNTRIPITELRGILIVSVQTSLSDRLVAQLRDDITRRITETNPHGLAIDLTGIDLMDSYISKTIRDIGMISRLMGVKTVISGMNPMIAMTLTEMGMDLAPVESALNLDAAISLLEQAVNEQEDAIRDLDMIMDQEITDEDV